MEGMMKRFLASTSAVLVGSLALIAGLAGCNFSESDVASGVLPNDDAAVDTVGNHTKFLAFSVGYSYPGTVSASDGDFHVAYDSLVANVQGARLVAYLDTTLSDSQRWVYRMSFPDSLNADSVRLPLPGDIELSFMSLDPDTLHSTAILTWLTDMGKFDSLTSAEVAAKGLAGCYLQSESVLDSAFNIAGVHMGADGLISGPLAVQLNTGVLTVANDFSAGIKGQAVYRHKINGKLYYNKNGVIPYNYGVMSSLGGRFLSAADSAQLHIPVKPSYVENLIPNDRVAFHAAEQGRLWIYTTEHTQHMVVAIHALYQRKTVSLEAYTDSIMEVAPGYTGNDYRMGTEYSAKNTESDYVYWGDDVITPNYIAGETSIRVDSVVAGVAYGTVAGMKFALPFDGPAFTGN